MPKDQSDLPRVLRVLAWFLFAACSIGLLFSVANSVLGLVPYFLGAAFSGGVTLFSLARGLTLLEQIRDASERSATAAEDDE